MLDTPKAIATRLRRSAFAFPLVALAAVALLLISESSYWRAKESLDELGNMGAARTAIGSLHRGIVDVESAQRGYLLTRDESYLVPYRDGSEIVRESLASLRKLADHNATRGGVLDKLEGLVQAKLSEMETTLGMVDNDQFDQAMALMRTNIGQEKMDEIRDVASQLFADETNKVAVGRKDVYETLMLNRIGVGAMTALSLLALFMYLRQTRELEAQRVAQQLAIQAERDQLEREVVRRTAQLTELARHLQTAREDERHRLARELHDELGALLTAAKLDAARLKSRVAALAPEALERLNHLVETLNSGIALKRRIIEDLRPSALSNLGLNAALDILAREFADRSGVAVEQRLEPVSLTQSAELTVYRLVQESLTNVGKYAKARRVTIELGVDGAKVCVAVGDDGIGFDPELAQASSHGLFGMRYRVEAEGGQLEIDAAPGRGTRIRALLPGSAVAA